MKLVQKSSFCLVVMALLMAPVARAGGFDDYAAMPKAWEAAYNSGDAAATAAYYAEDGVRMPPNAPIVKGREAIQALIQEGMDGAIPKVQIEGVEHFTSGDAGWARGTYKIIDAEGNVVDSGKWLNVGKKVDGKWYAHADIWNSDNPLPE